MPTAECGGIVGKVGSVLPEESSTEFTMPA